MTPSMGGVDIQSRDINKGVVTVQCRRPISKPSACHVDRTRATEEIVIGIPEHEFKEVGSP